MNLTNYQTFTAKSLLRLILLLVLCYGAGYISSGYMTPLNMDWYNGLFLSSLTPPSWVFSVVWFLLYGIMAYAAWLVWPQASHRYFYFQLVTTVLWSYTFFEAHMTFYSFLILIALTLFISEMLKEFYRYSKLSARLLVPYLAWIVFASYLNAYVFMYN